MRIAYFLDIANGLGGAGNLLLQQARLMSQIYDVIVVIPCDENGNGNQEYIRRCRDKGLKYRLLHYKTSYNFYYIDYLHAVESQNTIKCFAIEEKIDFFHSVQLNIAAEMVARELKLPHLMNIYSLRKEEFALSGSDIYPHYHLCDSQLFARQWSSILKIKSKCIRPVAPLMDIRKKSHNRKPYYKIVMLGYVCKRKNQLAAIKAVESCLNQFDIVLEIAGSEEPKYADRCKRYVEQCGLCNKVHFKGFVSDITSLLEQCDCLLCASTDESFPSSIVEAVTYDLTIISTPIAGVPEIFQDKYNAYIANGFQAKDISKTIMECIRAYEEESIEAIHHNAHKTWEKYFAPNIIRNEIFKYYNEILEDNYIGNVDIYANIPTEQMRNLSKAIQLLDTENLTYQRVFYYTYLKKYLHGKKAYIWGAGKLGSLANQLIQILELDIEIIAFIDKYKCGEYYGKPIICPNKIKYENDYCFFISFWEGRENIIELLNTKGVIYNQQSFLLP